MQTDEIYNFFRSLIDEDDTTFLTEDQANTMLKEAYSEFRDIVNTIEPDVYSTQDFITLQNTDVYDLTIADPLNGNKYLGATATNGKRIARLVRIGTVDSQASNKIQFWLTPVPNVEDLSGDDYARQGNKIVFGYEYNRTFRMEYVPHHTATFGPAGGAFLDDLDQFHPLIALIAAKYYEIRDGAESAALERRRREKIKELKTWLTRFWKGGIAQRTHRTLEL